MAVSNAEQFADFAQKGDKFKFIEVFKLGVESDGPAAMLGALREAGKSAGDKMGKLVLDAIVVMSLKTTPSRRKPQAIEVLAEVGPTGDEDGVGDAENIGLQLIQNGDASILKFAAVLLRAYGIQPDCTNMQPNIKQQIAQRMLTVTRFRGAGHVASALALLPGLLNYEGHKTVLQKADDNFFFAEAEALAKILTKDIQEHLINYRLTRGNHRAAARAVHLYKMEDHFTDCDYVWRSDAFNAAITKGKAKEMMGLAIAEPRLRQQAAETLVNWNMPLLAADIANQWGLGMPTGVQELMRKMQSKFKKYNLELPSDFVVHFISATSVESNLLDGINAMLNAPAVGLYLETSPVSSSCANHCDTSTPSVLSISTPDCGFVFNLESLGGDEAFVSMMESLVKSQHIAKVGIGVASDLERLATSYPLLQKCKDEARFLVEADHMVTSQNVYERMQKPASEQTLSPRSRKTEPPTVYDGKPINSFSEKYLGKSLHTMMAISDWTRCPLSDAQLRYTSLNAFIPLQLYVLCLAYGLPRCAEECP